MTEFRDLSKLPDDVAYWEGLEARIVADLTPRIRAAAPSARWWSPLAARAWRLGGLAAAAAIAVLLFAPERSGPAPNPTALLSLPEGDPGLQALVSAPAPPSLASLLLPDARSPR